MSPAHPDSIGRNGLTLTLTAGAAVEIVNGWGVVTWRVSVDRLETRSRKAVHLTVTHVRGTVAPYAAIVRHDRKTAIAISVEARLVRIGKHGADIEFTGPEEIGIRRAAAESRT